jgi:hypothetical protein
MENDVAGMQRMAAGGARIGQAAVRRECLRAALTAPPYGEAGLRLRPSGAAPERANTTVLAWP